MKDQIRKFIFKMIGYPTDVQGLLDDITDLGDVQIHQIGVFPFHLVTPENKTLKFQFETAIERKAFSAGVYQGMLAGGLQPQMSSKSAEADEMDKASNSYIHQDKVS